MSNAAITVVLGEKRQPSPTPGSSFASKKQRSDATSPVDSSAIYGQETAKLPTGNTSRHSKRVSNAAKRKRKKALSIDPGSHDDVFWHEVINLLGREAVDAAIEAGTDLDAPFAFREEVELEISYLSSNGEGLAIAPSPRSPWVVAVPFTFPGERVHARVYRHSRMLSFADLVRVEQANSDLRDMSLVKCRYFGTCAGCQYQMLPYEIQLRLKRIVVVRAYETFSDLPASSVPEVLDTAPSPLQYGYRTKITPHFDAPAKALAQRRRNGLFDASAPSLRIGFNKTGTREVMDIEECPIATPTINEALGPLRKNVLENISSYKKGASLLLRESLPTGEDADKALDKRKCVTDHRATVRERVGNKLFEYPGGSFFQNNNSILVPLVEYVRHAIFPSPSESPPPPAGPSHASSPPASPETPTHLVDAYCGSGLFSIMHSSHFSAVAGIELSADSIASATHNAQLNHLPPGRVTFRAGDAARIFDAVPDFPPARTAVIVDPPRKGCDAPFLEQLLGFRPATIVYVSCNVHTQARDVGILLRKCASDEKPGRYVLESVRGFDLFPQTAHVESVAVLRLLYT